MHFGLLKGNINFYCFASSAAAAADDDDYAAEAGDSTEKKQDEHNINKWMQKQIHRRMAKGLV